MISSSTGNQASSVPVEVMLGLGSTVDLFAALLDEGALVDTSIQRKYIMSILIVIN